MKTDNIIKATRTVRTMELALEICEREWDRGGAEGVLEQPDMVSVFATDLRHVGYHLQGLQRRRGKRFGGYCAAHDHQKPHDPWCEDIAALTLVRER